MSKIAIRVDTNKTIATGHVMRCMAVAAQLIKLGADVHVISADEGVRPFVDKTDDRIYAHIMDTDWSDMESELSALIEYLRSETINSLLVDSYQVTASYFERLREAGIHVVYMDDLCAQAYPVDALINYNICAPHMGYGEMYADRAEVYSEPKIEEVSDREAVDTENRGVKLYLGPRYAPLRSQFASPTNENRNSSLQNDSDDVLSGGTRLREKNAEDRLEDVSGIFLTTGGSDSLGIAETIIRAVLESSLLEDDKISFKSFEDKNSPVPTEANSDFPAAGAKQISDDRIKIHLLAGRYYEPTEYVLQAVESGKVVLHQNVDNVAKVMSTCKLAISSAGSTLYELCAMGIPTISFTFADNQIENALGFDREGIIPYAGDFRTDRGGCIRKILDFLTEYASVVRDYDTPGNSETGTSDQSILNCYSDVKNRMQTVTDGHGAERIAHIMIGLIQH